MPYKESRRAGSEGTTAGHIGRQEGSMANHALLVVVAGGAMVAIGGVIGGGHRGCTAELYDEGSGRWLMLNNPIAAVGDTCVRSRSLGAEQNVTVGWCVWPE